MPDGVTDISRVNRVTTNSTSAAPSPKPALPPAKPPNHVAAKASGVAQTASAPASTSTTPTGAYQPSAGPMHNSAIGLPGHTNEAAKGLPGHRRKGSTSSITSSGGATTPNSGQFSYSNLTSSMSNHSSSQTYAQVRAKLRPTGGFYSQFSPGRLGRSLISLTGGRGPIATMALVDSPSNVGKFAWTNKGQGHKVLCPLSMIYSLFLAITMPLKCMCTFS